MDGGGVGLALLIVIGVVVLLVLIPLIVVAVVVIRLLGRDRRPLRNPVAGTMRITSMSNPSQDSFLPNPADLIPSHENFVAEGMVELPGTPPYPARVADAAWTNRWPEVGQVIPVEADRANPSRVRIRWDDLRAGRP